MATMTGECGAQHPDVDVRCSLPDEHNAHDTHQVRIIGGATYEWRNDDYRPPMTPKRLREMADLAREKLVEERAVDGRRNVGAKSSVTQDDPTGRSEGAERAHQALEPEFLTAALVGGRDLAKRLERWTSDQLWDWLDERGFYTEHPKAMRGILTRLIKDKVIAPVPDEDPDSHRPPARSNQSRLLRVYRSLICEAKAIPSLRNFD